MATTRDESFHYFLSLPIETQIAVIQQIDDDKMLFRFFAASTYTWSLFKGNVNTIFKPRISHLTDQPTDPFSAYKAYLSNKGKVRPYVSDAEENHTALSYLVFKGFEKAVSYYLAAMTDQKELRHKARHGYNLLMLAILSNNPAMVNLILIQPEASELIDEANGYSDRPIHIAARVGNRSILKSLISHPSFNREHINLKGHYKYSPLANFCKYCDRDDVEFLNDLIGYGARTDESERGDNKCYNGIPAEISIHCAKPNVARILIDFIKHDLNVLIISPQYLLDDAIRRGYTDIVKTLALECSVKVNPTVSPGESLLTATLRFLDLELIRIVFQIESDLYEKIAVRQYSLSDGKAFNLPVFADYLLGAMNKLMSAPATRDTIEVYNLLLEFGLNPSMVWHRGGQNIFHFIARNLLTFAGKSKESVAAAQLIVADLIQRDALANFRHKTDDSEVTPLRLLQSVGNHRSAITFEEAVESIFTNLSQNAVDDIKKTDDQAMSERVPPVHDDADRCSIM